MDKRQIYFLKQKIVGLILIVIAVIAALATGGNITVSVLFGPAGLYLLFTKKMILDLEYKFEEEERIWQEQNEKL